MISKNLTIFFGANATGKTTVSRVIDSPDKYPSCSLMWKNQTPLESRVYNRNFVVRNFNQPLKGVFTLGEASIETLDKIKTIKEHINKLQGEIEILINTLKGVDGNGGKKAELAQLTQKYKKKFFTMKQKHSDSLSGVNSGEGMRGSIRSQDSFMDRVLNESNSNDSVLLTQAELEEKAKLVFSNKLTTIDPLLAINTKEILQHENNPILSKRIIGKNDVDIAKMILKLSNSDWVLQGLPFYEANDGKCPFCQEPTNESFNKSLTEYFDETFTKDSDEVKMLTNNYNVDTQRLLERLNIMIEMPSDFVDNEKLKNVKQLIDSIITVNKQRLSEKQKEGSQIVALESHDNALTKINELIIIANRKIAENNRIVSNLRSEKTALTAQIWKFVVTELEADINKYNRQKNTINKAIDSINTQITSKTAEIRQNKFELQNLETQTTSITPTKDAINRVLEIFGFKSFKLDLGDEPNTYKLIREDGSDAKNTLSEGERNFLSFLYFFHLLKGSQTDTGIANDKIVVIDDPISSLDNDVLFIVSTLIRELIHDVRENIGSVKQIFILTHNIYFHKEVTFNKKRNSRALNEETFWLVKKGDKVSVIEKQIGNPIKTSYELLWDEVRKDTRNDATIQNTLRRILEYYFKLLGGIQPDELYKRFDGEDKLKCKALCSWVNDGSHSSFDEEFYTPIDTVMIQKYLSIFKQIFQETGHIAHYNMMMGISTDT